MSKGDQLIERGAARLEGLARDAAAKGGFQAKLADELREDAEFLRKLKPSLIAARARGEAPKDQTPGSRPQAPSAPQITRNRMPRMPKKKRNASGAGGGGPNPWVVAGVAVAAGIALAKLIDWRGHAHPRD
jgi:hypothetical protein